MTIERFRASSRSNPPGRHGLLPYALLLLLLLILAPALARAQSFPTGTDSLTLSWTAPGDDGMIGTAAAYDVRVSATAITAASFAGERTVPGPPAPLPASSRQTLVVRGLARGTVYWFAIKSVDAAGNWSGISNVLRWTWPLDATAPAAPAGLSAVYSAGGGVRLQWNPNVEPDLAGYHVYRATSAAGPWSRIDATLLPTPQFLDTQVPAGADRVWYAVSAADAVGNESARSAAVEFVPAAALTRAPAAWQLVTAYPNPSRVGTSVRFPVEVPAGAGAATIDILDAAGQRVRRLAVPSGMALLVEVTWDGRNDAGAPCAPGVYRAWLAAGGTRQMVRVARLP